VSVASRKPMNVPVHCGPSGFPMACIWRSLAIAAMPVRSSGFEMPRTRGYLDFLQSAAAIAPVLEPPIGERGGETILQCIEATRHGNRDQYNLGSSCCWHAGDRTRAQIANGA